MPPIVRLTREGARNVEREGPVDLEPMEVRARVGRGHAAAVRRRGAGGHGARARLPPGHRRQPGGHRGDRGAQRPRPAGGLPGRGHGERDRVHRREPRALPRGRVPQHVGQPPQRRAGGRARRLHGARRRLRRHRQGGGGRAGHRAARRPDRRAAGSREPDRVATQTLVAGDRVHPATRDLPLELNRTDVWYRWQTRPTGTVHTVARWHALDAPAGDGTSTGGTDHPISWCRDVRGGRSFYTGMGRTAGSYSEQPLPRAPARRDPVGRGPGARQLQGDDQRQLPRYARRRRRAGRHRASPRAASRTGWSSPRTAG